jgi:hypothetical protein
VTIDFMRNKVFLAAFATTPARPAVMAGHDAGKP